MASLTSIHVYLENLLYTKFCVYYLEKKYSFFRGKKAWFPIGSAMWELGALDKYFASESQNFICKMMIIKSSLVEPILVSVPFYQRNAPSLHRS